MNEHVDVLVVGAGLSGVAAGYYLQTRCPSRSYVILEKRHAIGGTWDLFRYPGIRCDSNMFELGFPFRPWPHDEIIASGAAIRDYIEDTAREFGIDRHIRFGHAVVAANWSSAAGRWVLEVEREGPDGAAKRVTITANFVISCTGYYSYENPYTPEFPGRSEYRGEFVHPQLWREDIDYAGKQVVVIGSGATAVTLVPTLAQRAAKVTMLQRSPSFFINVSSRDPLAALARRWLPADTASAALRWKNVLLATGFYHFCRRFPDRARKLLEADVARRLPPGFDVATHFDPHYEPWDQRICLVPDDDFFSALRDERAEIVTDHIERFTETGVRLASGRELDADLVVSATGLNIEMLGGVEASIDGVPVVPGERIFYRGVMFDAVPNFVLALGYTNATWTLKIELVLEYVCRLLQHMDETGTDVVVARREPDVEQRPMIDMNSGYIRRMADRLPKAGSRRPWKLYQNYLLDRVTLRRASLDDGVLEFSRSAGDAAA